jgi:hypothetical protein
MKLQGCRCLGMLQAQIVGLLSSPGMQLAAVLSEASGGKLARTLEGLKKSVGVECRYVLTVNL